jgi:hypothetical protein
MKPLLLCLSLLLPGCAGLTAGTALQTAHEAAKVACSLIQGSTAPDVLAALANLQRDVTVALAGAATGRVDAEQVASLVRSLGALSEAQRALAEQLVAMAGEGPVKVVPCAVAPPAASVPLGAAPVSP